MTTRNPHYDPSKPTAREKSYSIICGDCGAKVTASGDDLKAAAERHFATCPRKDASVARR
jgi:hypothetical protein